MILNNLPDMKKLLVAGALTGVAATGCLDLEVENPNDPDRERALATASDVENLVGGAFSNWWNCQSANSGPGPILMTMAYQHSSMAANFGMVEFSFPNRIPAHNLSEDTFHGQNVGNCWTWTWRTVASVVDGLGVIEAGEVELDEERLARVEAFGYLNLALGHAHAALLYDQGYIYEPGMDPEGEEVEQLHPYEDVMEAAFGYFDRSIQAAENAPAGTPETPSSWASQSLTVDEIKEIAHSFRARYRANMARTPEERQAVDWDAVVADVEQGISENFEIRVTSGSGFSSGNLVNTSRLGAWGQLHMQVAGMADQSGNYQTWIALDPDDRQPIIDDENMLIHTPDERFAQGDDVDEQTENPGTHYGINTGPGGAGAQWVRSDRGTFRWSWYRATVLDMWNEPAADRTTWPEITMDEMNLLVAEAYYYAGEEGAAADIINETREAAGLSATDASGVNESCVPRLANEECGDLFEMLKWEVRMQTMYKGLNMASWYFHGRGWGDLREGTFLQIPAPAEELLLLGEEPYTFGGPGGESSAPVGNYGY